MTLTEDFSFLDKAQLVKLRLRAVRSGAWFGALSRIDRVLIDLTIKVAVKLRSAFLARSILSVTRKLESLLESELQRAIREFGFATVYKLSGVALKWGYKAAGSWPDDVGFARFWAVMKLNGHPGLG